MKSDGFRILAVDEAGGPLHMTHSARIGILNEDGTVTSVFCSLYGQLRAAGYFLEKYYKTDAEVRRMLRKGDFMYFSPDTPAIPVNPGMGMMLRCPEALYTAPFELLPWEIRNLYLFFDGSWKYKSTHSKKPLGDQRWKFVKKSLDNFLLKSKLN